MFDQQQMAYRALRDIVAERTRPLVLWTGAGVSASVGLPTWTDLRRQLADALVDKIHTNEETSLQSQLRGSLGTLNETSNPWVAFEILKSALGQTTYRDVIRQALEEAGRVPVPDVYGPIWSLRPRAVLTTNLDRLAARGFAENATSGQLPPVEYSGRAVARMRQRLTRPDPTIAYLHGQIDDYESWVFTKSELNYLTRDRAYRGFLELTLSSATNVFIGISADDIAVGGHLARLASLGIETPTHFWFTNRADAGLDRWAENAQIRLIRYMDKDGSHADLLEALKALSGYVAEEKQPAPIVSSGLAAPLSLPSPAELLSWQDMNHLRSVLNAEASRILEPRAVESYREFERFVAEYDQAIYRAWYLSPLPGTNNILNCTIDGEIATGAFGKVFHATDESGQSVAVKLLREEIRRSSEALQAFRRGVESMRILSQSDVDGMVRYKDASEIPAVVVMDWVPGPSLHEAIRNRYLSGWGTILRVARDIAAIVNQAHRLPERVLHRDIRPNNIVISDWYSDRDEWRVVVLDFDLSWHKDAPEKSILHASISGYLAPEQHKAVGGVSTRNAGVDSYGLGMTLFFMAAGEDPTALSHLRADWVDMVRAASARVDGNRWKSLPDRCARLILAMTQGEQSKRMDMIAIIGELDRLIEAEGGGWIDDVEFVAEEIAALTPFMVGYQWNEDERAATVGRASGLTVHLGADLQAQTLTLMLRRQATGGEDRAGFVKYLKQGISGATARLKTSGWRIDDSAAGSGEGMISATRKLASVEGRIGTVASDLQDVLARFSH